MSKASKHDAGDLALAGFMYSTHLSNLLIEKGVLTVEEGAQVWRKAAATTLAGPIGNRAGIHAVLKAAAPEGLID